MAHHHKPNKAVEGDPDTGHRGGMPLRPDDDALQERTAEERADIGLDARAAGPFGEGPPEDG